MTDQIRENIISMYDGFVYKNRGIASICKMFAIKKDEVEEILKAAGRDLPSDKHKKEVKEDPVPQAKEPEVTKERELPIPQYIFDVLLKELDVLDAQIAKKSNELLELSTRYTEISDFIKKYRP